MRGAYQDDFCQKCRVKDSGNCHSGADHLVETRRTSTVHTDAWGNSYTTEGELLRTWAVHPPFISEHCRHPKHLKSKAVFDKATEEIRKLNEETVARMRDTRFEA
jgi:hypothetical protein